MFVRASQVPHVYVCVCVCHGRKLRVVIPSCLYGRRGSNLECDVGVRWAGVAGVWALVRSRASGA